MLYFLAKSQNMKVAVKYKHLTQELRYQIYAFSKANYTQEKISKRLEVHKSTVSREIKRNSGLRGYRPKQAQNKYEKRKSLAKKRVKMNTYYRFIIAEKIRQEWRPEQISGYFKLNGIANISHQSIYSLIEADRKKGRKLYRHLRHSRKKRKKTYGSSDFRGQIKNRISIDERPKIVDEKSRIGNWEVDTIVGKNHKGIIVTAVERKSKYIIASQIPDKSAEVVTNALISSLGKCKNKVITITGDNGKEFAYHEKIAKNLEAKFFFAHPYCSWERGLNENSNGLIRQYYPKKTDLRGIDKNLLSSVLEKINTRPRKTLGYATPKEVFFGLISAKSLDYGKVALVT